MERDPHHRRQRPDRHANWLAALAERHGAQNVITSDVGAATAATRRRVTSSWT